MYESGENDIPFFRPEALCHLSRSPSPANIYLINEQESLNGCNLNIKAFRKAVGRNSLEVSLPSVVSWINFCLLNMEATSILHFIIQ